MFALPSRMLAYATLGGLLLSACVTIPPMATGPSIAALPPAGMSLQRFSAIELACRQFAQPQASSQHAYDVAYAQCMVSKGARIPNLAALNAPVPVVEPRTVVVSPPPPMWVWGGYGPGWYGPGWGWGGYGGDWDDGD